MKRRSEYPLLSSIQNKKVKKDSSIIPKITTNKNQLNYDYSEESNYDEKDSDYAEDDEINYNNNNSNVKSSYVKRVLNNTPYSKKGGNISNSNDNTTTNNEINTKQDKYTYSKTKSSKRIRNQEQDDAKINEEDINTVIQLLPCREKEQLHIYNYIKKGLETNGSYTGLYISGMPGTGKTACVTTVINKLRKESQRKEVAPFTVCELNGMKITNPNNVFKYIYEHLFTDGRSTNIKKCTAILDNFFKNRKDYNFQTQLREYTNPHLILVIDEIDCLINKKQMLLYNIFNWTTYHHSKLIIISISNTLDLPEKLLPKISSRIGNNRLSFKPYQKDELVKILSVKIENFELFSDDAIKLSAMKVAAVNGDLRRILQICRRAKEMFDSEDHDIDDKIEKSHILRATEDLFDSKVQFVIKSLQLYEKLAIAAILFQMKIQQNDRIQVVSIYDRLKYFYQKMFGKACLMTFEDFMMIIYTLNKLQIINIPEGFSPNFVNVYVCLKFYADEFTVTMEKDEQFKDIMKEF